MGILVHKHILYTLREQCQYMNQLEFFDLLLRPRSRKKRHRAAVAVLWWWRWTKMDIPCNSSTLGRSTLGLRCVIVSA